GNGCDVTRRQVGEQQLVDALGVDQLPGSAGTDRADTDEQRLHRNSGASSSRQPPLVGGTPPLPRRRANNPISAATPKTRSTRRKALTTRECIEDGCDLNRPGTRQLLRSTPSRGYSSVG